MKIIKALFIVLLISTSFIACETDSVDEQIAIELDDVVGEDEGGQQVQPGNTNG